MSERPNPAIVDKIRRILAKTMANGATQAESDTAFAMASNMLAMHNLSMADIHVNDSTHCDSFVEQAAHETSRWTLENNLAYNITKEFFFVEGILIPHQDNGKILFFFGTEANVEVAKYTFRAILASFERLWTTYRIIHKKPNSEKRLFIAGVAGGYSSKLRDERKAMQAEQDISRGSSGGTALALRSIADETSLKFREKHPDSKKGTTRFASTNGDKSTFDAGQAAGRKMNLARPLPGGGNTGRKALGSN